MAYSSFPEKISMMGTVAHDVHKTTPTGTKKGGKPNIAVTGAI